jgi:hypothetical protein
VAAPEPPEMEPPETAAPLDSEVLDPDTLEPETVLDEDDPAYSEFLIQIKKLLGIKFETFTV